MHQFAEMPLNHLGLLVEYHDVRGGLPDPARPDVRGVLLWTDVGDWVFVDDVTNWLARAVAAGKLIVSFGPLPDISDSVLPQTPAARQQVLAALGLVSIGATESVSFRDEVVFARPDLIGFERKLDGPLPRYLPAEAAPGAEVLLSPRSPGAGGRSVDIATLGPAGGYVDHRFVMFKGRIERHRQWIVNPFEFFRRAYRTDTVPKADVTTLAGRRIYYRYINGDGWRNISTVDGYLRSTTMSAKVVLEEAIRPFPDLPVTVAPVTADLDPGWYGTAASQRIARELFRLGQVELGTHTHTHPFFWRFYAPSDPALERPFPKKYQNIEGRTRPLLDGWAPYDGRPIGPEPDIGIYPRPRA